MRGEERGGRPRDRQIKAVSGQKGEEYWND